MSVPRIRLGSDGYTISRLIVGGWQLSEGHRNDVRDERDLFADLWSLVEAGLTTFDCADIYTGVEELFGRFAAAYRAQLADAGIALQVHTKYVPNLDQLANLRRVDVEAVIDRSLRRLGVERLDLVQFHWWDYEIPGYVETAGWLEELRRAGKIRLVGATNFDAEHLAHMIDAGVPIAANQVQYSVLDRRPAGAMTELARARDVGLLCYGTIAGGFLSARYLGAPEPTPPFANRSLTKYRLIIDEVGGWPAFQGLLGALDQVARKHDTTLTAVAVRSILDRPAARAAIVGTFHAEHLARTLEIVRIELDADDRSALERALDPLPPPAGPVFALERGLASQHRRIMKTNLNPSQGRD